MPFNSKDNRITVRGIVYSNIEPVENNNYAITFKVKIMRPAEVGKEQRFDIFDVYVCDRQNVNNVLNNLTRGLGVSVKGELRTWFDGTFKICANKIEPIW
ncbi:single-stranded DNA-binding protein [Ruminococcus sp. Marseille-P6503]|uniref:single-stranded DNA-binding protein n=1 Tax=Ruminococcus sp. Marseille-P6503 TaxID=2364796 RepID=UPI000F549A94|nr:single-stranded DNA-binding protein [Ruminococcus sp. Marseille-P6503]